MNFVRFIAVFFLVLVSHQDGADRISISLGSTTVAAFPVNPTTTKTTRTLRCRTIFRHGFAINNQNNDKVQTRAINHHNHNDCHHQLSRRGWSRNELYTTCIDSSSSSIDLSYNTNNKTKPENTTSATTQKAKTTSTININGIGPWILQLMIQSPLWKNYVVPMARQKIIQTAYENHILWNECLHWLRTEINGPWNDNTNDAPKIASPKSAFENDLPFFYNYFNRNATTNSATNTVTTKENYNNYPSLQNWYVKAPYHAYERGHLNWDAALESELASATIGVRNMPSAGRYGEIAFRTQFTKALEQYIGNDCTTMLTSSSSSTNDKNRIILDIGCATGGSTRWIANRYPNFNGKIIGIDLSPYNVAVARKLQELTPTERFLDETNDDDDTENNEYGTWISTIPYDDRIVYDWQDGTNTLFPDDSIDIVNFQFVAHELPVNVTCQIIRESCRILQPDGGQFWFSEMDFEAPSYIQQRANPLLFALIRSTEPYLDEYADNYLAIQQCLRDCFDSVILAPATGRHFVIIATKKKLTYPSKEEDVSWTDLRFDEHGHYKIPDTHLQVWQNKKRTIQK